MPLITTRDAWMESGDRLDRAEFHRRYEQTPQGFRAELLDGIVYVPSPVSAVHGKPDSLLHLVLELYTLETPGADQYGEVTLILPGDNEPQPDACLRILPELGGISRLTDRFLHGPIELVCEVAYSSVARDLHLKRAIYEAAGCLEYLVVIAEPAQIVWWALEDGEYVDLLPGDDGLFRSRVFPGLWLDPVGAAAGDRRAVLAALRRGLASPEHAAFVEQLAARRPR